MSKSKEVKRLEEVLAGNVVILHQWRVNPTWITRMNTFLEFPGIYGFPHLSSDISPGEAWDEIHRSLLHRSCKVCDKPIPLRHNLGWMRHLDNWLCSSACAMKRRDLDEALLAGIPKKGSPKLGPDEDVIKARCAMIQASWNETFEESRATAGQGRSGWMPPGVGGCVLSHGATYGKKTLGD